MVQRDCTVPLWKANYLSVGLEVLSDFSFDDGNGSTASHSAVTFCHTDAKKKKHYHVPTKYLGHFSVIMT